VPCPCILAAKRYRKVSRRPVAGTGRRTVTDRQHSANVREWAKGQGFKISDRGRIPESIEREFAAAH
jgi:Lsr2